MFIYDHSENHPMSRAINALDGILIRSQEISLSPSDSRLRLRIECKSLFEELRAVATDHISMAGQSVILPCLDLYESEVSRLANINGLTKDQRDGIGNCQVCFAPLFKCERISLQIVFCEKCMEQCSKHHAKLISRDGFCIRAI